LGFFDLKPVQKSGAVKISCHMYLCEFEITLHFYITHMLPCSEDEKVKNFVLSKSGREFNSYHLGPFPVEKYSILTILDHFSDMVDLRMGPFLTSS
jgi:hypothetical protein